MLGGFSFSSSANVPCSFSSSFVEEPGWEKIPFWSVNKSLIRIWRIRFFLWAAVLNGRTACQNRAKTVNKILIPDIYLDDDSLEYFLRVLKENMFCPWHANRQGLEKVAI